MNLLFKYRNETMASVDEFYSFNEVCESNRFATLDYN